MSARRTVALGSVAILGLASLLVWVRAPDGQTTVSAAEVSLSGLSVTSVAGVDHLTERYVGPVGYTTLADQLAALNVELHPEDRYTAIPDPALGVGSVIEIIRATPVTVLDGTETREYRTWATTVEELLKEANVTLDDDDRIEPGFSTTLEQDKVITITRVGVDEETKTEELPFKTVTKKDDGLEKGKTRVEQAGRVGLKRLTYAVTRENGQEVGRKLLNTETVREPEEKIILEGTKVISYGSGSATWYGLKSGMSAAHNTLPKGTWVKVTNVSNGKSVDVVINDHGIQGGAIIDLTKEAFAQLAPLGAGRIQVKLEKDWD